MNDKELALVLALLGEVAELDEPGDEFRDIENIKSSFAKSVWRSGHSIAALLTEAEARVARRSAYAEIPF